MNPKRERAILYSVVVVVIVTVAIAAMITWRGMVARSACADPDGALTRAGRLADVNCGPVR